MSWALSRKISIGHFRHRIRPSASMIREQKQCSSSPASRASRQYKIYSDNALVSLSVKVVVTDVLGTPSTGVNTSAASSLVIAAAVPVSV